MDLAFSQAVLIRLFCLLVCLCSTAQVAHGDGCSEAYFLICVTRLRIQRVPFDQNMLNVVFNITSEAKLRQACIAYTDVLPCFRDRILQCGNDKQRQLMDEVAKMIKFFCSPFSVKRQEVFLKHVGCIGKVLQMPATTDCYSNVQPEFTQIEQCRQVCYEKREFLCMMKIWVSEQNLCTLIDIEKNCEPGSVDFYQQLQINVFSDQFPLVCDHDTTGLNTASTVPATKFSPSVDPMDFFRKTKYGNSSTVTPMTLPPSIPVIYSRTRGTPPPPVTLPAYIPVYPGQFSNRPPESGNFNFQSINDRNNNNNNNGKYTNNMPPQQQQQQYPFNQPLPDAGRFSGDISQNNNQWKPWYLGGQVTTVDPRLAANEINEQRRVVLSDRDSSSSSSSTGGIWESFKNSDLFNLGKELFQGNNPFTRIDASVWPFGNGATTTAVISVQLKLYIFFALISLKYFFN